MLISTLDDVEFAPEYPELAGRRILISGVAGAVGIDVVRAFAEAGTRLIVQAVEDSPETLAMAEIIAPHAMDVHLVTGPIEGAEAMLRFARDAAQRFGGLDCVINLAQCPDAKASATGNDVERLVSDALAMPVLATRVAVNRMRTMMAVGSIVNVLIPAERGAAAGQLLEAIARNTLASFTRNEAEAASVDDIRINAIVPLSFSSSRDGTIGGAADVATLALHLSSGRSQELSGLVFEAYCG